MESALPHISKIRPVRINGDIAFVPLTQGYDAIIDAADVPLVEGFNWTANVGPRLVYAVRWVRLADGKWRAIGLHRTILDAPDERQVDHVNSNGLDNRRSNLRLATASQNQHNQRRRCDNTSGFKGVYWHKERAKWRARIKLIGHHKHLGYFDTPEAAHAAYVEAANRFHGEFARGA